LGDDRDERRRVLSGKRPYAEPLRKLADGITTYEEVIRVTAL